MNIKTLRFSGNAAIPLALCFFLPSSGYTQAFAAPNVYYNSYEYPDMRPTATQLFNTDGSSYWQTSTLGAVPMGAGEEPNQPAGVYTGAFNTEESPIYVNDSALCHGGNWCFRYDVNPNLPGIPGGGAETWITQGNALTTNEHTFVQEYLKFPTGYQFDFGKLLYLRDYNGTTVILVKRCSPVCASTYLDIEVTGPSHDYECNMGLPCNLTGDNQWHSMEVETNPNGGGADAATIRFWLDGNLVLEYCPTCAQHATIQESLNAGGIGFGEYLNGTCCGGALLPHAQSFWMDDLAVSTQRIGPGSGQSLPPSIPTDLNGDGVTNVTDVQLGVNQALGAAACSSGDVNKDGACNVVDVQQIVNKALGL